MKHTDISAEAINNIEDILNTTPMQNYYYNILRQTNENTILMDLEFNFSGTFDANCIKKSWQSVIQKYPILRTSFLEGENHSIFQIIHKNIKEDIEFINWKGLPSAKQEKLKTGIRENKKRRKQSFDAVSLFRFSIIEKREGEFMLWWRFPVLLMDGWNVPTILSDFIHSYKISQTKQNPLTFFPSHSMKEYIQRVNGQEHNENSDFWKNYLNRSFLPKSKDSIEVISYDRIDVDLSKKEKDIRCLAKEIGVTLNSLCQTICMAALANYKNTDYCICRTTVADRPIQLADVNERVGLYIAELPIVLRREEKSFKQAVSQMQKDLNDILANIVTSFTSMEYFESLEHFYAIEDTITFENMPTISFDFSKLPFKLKNINFENHPYGKINIFIWAGEKMNLKLIYDKNSFSKSDMERLGKSIINLIDKYIKNPDTKI